jgi:hypothetical protein
VSDVVFFAFVFVACIVTSILTSIVRDAINRRRCESSEIMRKPLLIHFWHGSSIVLPLCGEQPGAATLCSIHAREVTCTECLQRLQSPVSNGARLKPTHPSDRFRFTSEDTQ